MPEGPAETKTVDQMTAELLAQRDPTGEARGWHAAIAEQMKPVG